MSDAVASSVREFFAHYPERQYAPREVLIYANEPPAGIFYLESGQVRQYDISKQGSDVVVNTFKAGAFFPMNWAITRMPNRYFYEAVPPVVTRLAPAADVLDFLHHNEPVLFNLVERLYVGVEGMQRRMAHLMGGTARTLVVFEIITESKRFGTKDGKGGYRITLHEEELAHRTGLTRETVNRVVGELKKEFGVSVNHAAITVPNLAALEHSLEDDL